MTSFDHAQGSSDFPKPNVSRTIPASPISDRHKSNSEIIPQRSLRKRKPSLCRDGYDFEGLAGVDLDGEVLAAKLPPTKKKKVEIEVPLKYIRTPPLSFPKSSYNGHIPSLPMCSERSVLQEILFEERKKSNSPSDNGDAFIEVDLEDFSVYRPDKFYRGNKQKSAEEAPLSNELVSLHEINEWGVKFFYFDGVISYGNERRYIQKVPFELLSIGNYEELGCSSVGSNIWIQSVKGRAFGVWYRLRMPAAEYRRYHGPFLWMADLAKHVMDFFSVHPETKLNHFREAFYEWLQSVHPCNSDVSTWVERYGSRDFRVVIAAQANFLYCQATQVDSKNESHPLWREVHPRWLSAIPGQVERGTTPEMLALSSKGPGASSIRKTTVTPYVYECFSHLPWGKFLYSQTPPSIRQGCRWKINDIKTKTSPVFTDNPPRVRISSRSAPICNDGPGHVGVGDVIALPADKISTWKTDDADWYGYVQSIIDTKKGRLLGLLWLYRPSDTECLKMRYPYINELFLSDHCNCGDPPILAQEVTRKVQVAFYGAPDIQDIDFFVRQKYVQGDGAWKSLQDFDFRCDCIKDKEQRAYRDGDTLLVRIRNILEPVVFTEDDAIVPGDIKIRRLFRRGRDYGHADAVPNELVVSDHFQIIRYSDIARKCHVRFYTEVEKKCGLIPAPYSRQGTADHYYITMVDIGDDGRCLQPFTVSCRRLLREGWDPLSTPPQTPMRGLDIFCGGGSFGRGLEEGGSVRMAWAVDWCNEAIHTYRANMADSEATQLFRGSVNDYLTQAMQDKAGPTVAQYGEVDVISAGSPCPGFSPANPNKGNSKGLLDASMVASVVSFIDFYRPKYALMENVKGMAYGTDATNVLAQVICALLGIGYQVQTFSLDAWNFGSPQSRTRIFIALAAPGLEPIPAPAHTHSHPESVMSASLGIMPNGLRTNSRYSTPTPFKYITSAEATHDLPSTDARTSCIKFPDHRMSRPLSTLDRVKLSSVPRFPGGSTFMSAFTQGYMPQPQIDAFHWHNPIQARKDSACWQRVKRDALMPTVMTGARPWDGRCGACLHWDDDRLLTVMEVRRGQGFLDHEVVVGLPGEQWKIVGNSVARPVALALGLSLRTAWLINCTRAR